jgi:hypothetical protein
LRAPAAVLVPDRKRRKSEQHGGVVVEIAAGDSKAFVSVISPAETISARATAGAVSAVCAPNQYVAGTFTSLEQGEASEPNTIFSGKISASVSEWERPAG